MCASTISIKPLIIKINTLDSHGNLKQINPDRDDFGKILDCGVENAKAYNGTAFFDIDEVVAILRKKNVSSFDHH